MNRRAPKPFRSKTLDCLTADKTLDHWYHENQPTQRHHTKAAEEGSFPRLGSHGLLPRTICSAGNISVARATSLARQTADFRKDKPWVGLTELAAWPATWQLSPARPDHLSKSYESRDRMAAVRAGGGQQGHLRSGSSLPSICVLIGSHDRVQALYPLSHSPICGGVILNFNTILWQWRPPPPLFNIILCAAAEKK